MSDTSTSTTVQAKRLTWRRHLLRSFGWVTAFYIGLIIVLKLLENSLVYFPVRASTAWMPPPAGHVVEDVWVQTADGTKIHGWWFTRPGASGALLYAHGNAGNLSCRGPAAVDLMEALGASILLFDYPSFGKSEGKISEAGCYAAADAMYDWLTQTQQIPGEHIILYGKSLGGGVATELAVRRPHRALVLAKSFTSIPDMAQRQFPFIPARWLVSNRFDNLRKIRHFPGPVVIAHADHDELVPHWMAEELFQAAPDSKAFFFLENCGHNSPLPPSFLDSLALFLAETAPLSSSTSK